MPSQKGTEQALTWLRSKAMERDTLDGINAEICLNVISDLQRQNSYKGSIIGRMKTTLREETRQAAEPEEMYFRPEGWI